MSEAQLSHSNAIMTKNEASLADTCTDATTVISVPTTTPSVLGLEIENQQVTRGIKIACDYQGRRMSLWFDLSEYANETGDWKLDAMYPAIRQAVYKAISQTYCSVFCPRTYFAERHILLFYLDQEKKRVIVNSPFALGAFLQSHDRSTEEWELEAWEQNQFGQLLYGGKI